MDTREPTEISKEDYERLHKDNSVITEDLRQWWILQVMQPLEEFLLRLGAKPNHITALASLCCLVIGYAYAQGQIILGGWLVFLMGSLDILDGRIARRLNLVSKEGNFLDSVMDRYQDVFVFIGLALFYSERKWMLLIVLFNLLAVLIVPYTRAKAEAMGVQLKRVGLMQRPERIFIIGMSSILAGIVHISLRPFMGRADFPFHVLDISLLFLAIMVNFSAYQRIQASVRQLKILDGESKDDSNSEK